MLDLNKMVEEANNDPGKRIAYLRAAYEIAQKHLENVPESVELTPTPPQRTVFDTSKKVDEALDEALEDYEPPMCRKEVSDALELLRVYCDAVDNDLGGVHTGAIANHIAEVRGKVSQANVVVGAALYAVSDMHSFVHMLGHAAAAEYIKDPSQETAERSLDAEHQRCEAVVTASLTARTDLEDRRSSARS